MELHHESIDMATKAGAVAGSDIEDRYRDAMSQLFGRTTPGYRVEPIEVVSENLPRVLPSLENHAG